MGYKSLPDEVWYISYKNRSDQAVQGIIMKIKIVMNNTLFPLNLYIASA